jgi:CspA family cold shock protein
MQTGTVATLVREKNFGFIKVEGMEKDLFFHANQLKNVDFASLNEGDTLSFEVAPSERDPSKSNAVNVSKV